MTRSEADQHVTIVTVAYNSTSVLPAMLSSLPPQTPVVIVDNASQDHAALEGLVSARKTATKLVTNTENLGFGSACNIGAEHAKTEFLLFLNPDAALFADTLQKLLEAADLYPDAAAFNPRIIGEDGKPFLKRRSDLVDRGTWLAQRDVHSDMIVPVLSGAALFVRRPDFLSVGGFDPGIFLFFEDDDISIRLSNQGRKLMYVHEALVRHTGGASSDGASKSEDIKNWQWGYSQVYTLRKHARPGTCLTAFVKTGARGLSPVALFSRRRRRKYFKRLAGMIAALRIERPLQKQGPER